MVPPFPSGPNSINCFDRDSTLFDDSLLAPIPNPARLVRLGFLKLANLPRYPPSDYN